MEKRAKEILSHCTQAELNGMIKKQSRLIVRAGLKGDTMYAGNLGEDLDIMIEADEANLVRKKSRRRPSSDKKFGPEILQELELAGDIFRANATGAYKGKKR